MKIKRILFLTTQQVWFQKYLKMEFYMFQKIIFIGMMLAPLIGFGEPMPVHTKKLETPIRFAIGHLIVTKSTMSYDPKTGTSNTRDIVCDKNVKVPVYEFDKDSSFDTTYEDCLATVDGTQYVLAMSPMLYFSTFSLYDGAAPERFKVATAFAYFKSLGPPLPTPPFQIMATRDLNQKNFILLSRPAQEIVCGATTESLDQKCTVKYPVVFEVLWDIQDNQP